MVNDIPMHIVIQEAKREMADAINDICQRHNLPSWLGLMVLDDIVKENRLMSSIDAVKMSVARSADISEEADPDVGEG